MAKKIKKWGAGKGIFRKYEYLKVIFGLRKSKISFTKLLKTDPVTSIITCNLIGHC